MPELLAFACAYLAFAQLALSQAQHLKAVAPHARLTAASRLRRRAVGALLLPISLALLLGSRGTGFAVLSWVLLISAAGFGVALTLSWKPAWLRWLVIRGAGRIATPPRQAEKEENAD